MPVVEMRREHASAVARLHRMSIRTGLIAWLGQRFCEKLYWAMANTPYSFVLVYEDDQYVPLGFICCSGNTSRMYRHVLTRHFFGLLISAVARMIVCPRVVWSMLAAVRRPKAFQEESFKEWDLPEAELVSMGVSPESQGKRIGTQLVEASFVRFAQMGHSRVRVWTSEDNLRAKAFYEKQGFRCLEMRTHHTGGIYIFVAELDKEAVPVKN